MEINLANFAVNDEEFVVDRAEQQNQEDSAKQSKVNLKPVIQWLIYGLTFLLPLFFLTTSSEFLEFNKQTLLALGAGIGLILFLVDVIQNGLLHYKSSRLYLPLAVLVGASALTAVFSRNVYDSFMGQAGGSLSFSFVTIVSLAIFFFLALNVIEDRGKRLAKILTGSFTLVFLMSLLQVFGVHVLPSFKSQAVNFNFIGSLNTLAITGGLLLGLFLEAKLKLFRYLDVSKLLVAMVFFVIVLVNWWLVWLAAFISLAGWMALRMFETRKPSLRIFIMPLSVVAVGVLLVLINFNFPVLKSKLLAEVSPSYRASWQIAGHAIKEHPIFGYGQGNFGLAYDKYKPQAIASTIFADTRFSQSATSMFTVAAEGGIVMTLAWLFLIVWSGWELYRSRSGSAFTVFGLLLFFFLFSTSISTMFVLFALLALLELENGRNGKKNFDFEHSPVYSLIGSLVFIVGLVAVLAGGYFLTTRYIGDRYFVKALTAKNADEAIPKLTQAANINATNTDYYRVLSQAALNQLATELNNKTGSQQDHAQKINNLAASAIDIAKRATDADPNDAQNWINRGLIYQNLIGLVGGADSAAVTMYQESLKRRPTDPLTYSRIGAVYLNVAELARRLAANPPAGQNVADLQKIAQDDFVKAEENYKQAISLNNNFGQAVYDLGVVYEREGRLADSIKQLERVRSANPNNPALAFELGLLYYRNNQKDAAFTQLQQATTLFPNYSNARWYLSLLYEERGDLANALAQAEEIAKTNADNELVKQRITQLSSGKRTIPPNKVLDQKPL